MLLFQREGVVELKDLVKFLAHNNQAISLRLRVREGSLDQYRER